MNEKTAILFGATGLIGNYLLKELIVDSRYKKIIIFGRKNINIDNQKVDNIICDFKNLDNYNSLIKGNDLFCCIGTTIKKAKTQEEFRKIDYEIPVKLAEIANKSEIKNYIVVSSIGADLNSSNFYLRTKGEMEKDIQIYSNLKIFIIQPSLLLGKRNEFRLLEEIGKILFKIAGIFFVGNLKNYRAIHAKTVAKAMIKIANGDFGKKIFKSHILEYIGNSK